MEKKQILFRIIYALHHIHEYESLMCNDEAICHNLTVAEDVLFDVKNQLEKELFNEGEESEEHVRTIVATSK